MGHAEATLAGERIEVRTVRTPGVDDFQFMLAASKKVNGGSFVHRQGTGDKFWTYPLSIETCQALRRAFGEHLRVHNQLAAWYRQASAEASAHTALAAQEAATLSPRVPGPFAVWLRGYQRVGAKWMAQGYRGAGLVADMPGLGKTPQTLAGLLEADVRGPVLVVCPKASVRLVWGLEARTHLRGVPVYLCRGTRAARQRMLALFAKHMARDPNRLRIVVVVAEMLRIELGHPCYTKSGNKVSGMCPQYRRHGKCTKHYNTPEELKYFLGIEQEEKEAEKERTPVGFSYPELFHVSGGWSWVVLDESHKLLGSLTVRKGNLMGRALKLLPYRANSRRYALSGTPFGRGGRLQGLFGTLHWLWPDEYTSYWKWAEEVFEIQEKVVNRSGKTVREVRGPRGLRADATPEEEAASWESFLQSLGPRILRRTKEEMLKDLPPKSYREVPCELDPVQQKQYQELVEYAEITTPGGIVVANGTLPLRTRSQQLANGALTMGKGGKVQFTQNSGKLDRLWEMLDARGILDGLPGDKLVISSRYNEFLDAIAEMLRREKVGFYLLNGSVSDPVRDSMLEAWQTNTRMGQLDWPKPPRLLLVQLKAAGISVNMDAANEMHIMDEDPDPGVNQQLEDRIHRGSRNHKVVIYYYRTTGTVDYLAAHNVEYRRRLQHAVMDGSRGMVYLRELMTEALEAV